MSAALRSALFMLAFYPATLLFVLAAIVAALIGNGAVRRVVHAWSDVHHALLRHLAGIRIAVHGAIPPGPLLIAVKHQAMLETIEMLRLCDTPVIVLKGELADMPLFGWATHHYGVIPVDRSAGGKALRAMVAGGRKATAAGRPVIIYPEGTRVAPGETPPLQPGFAGLYRALGLPVVPVAVDSGRLWPRGFVKRPGTVRFHIGEPIPPGLPRAEIEARVHAAINVLEDCPGSRA